MKKMASRNILSFSSNEAMNFLNSFDTLVTDCDGVLWCPDPIPGVKETLSSLRDMGKKICFVSNNSTKNFESYHKQFQGIGVDLKESDIIHPTVAVIHYLKSINFQKKIFFIGTTFAVEALRSAGFDCVTGPNECPENMRWFIMNSRDEEDIGAVFIDFDININYYKISKAVNILKRPDVVYLVGATDKKVPVTSEYSFLGPGLFQSIVTEQSGRDPIVMGKPSEYLKAITMKHFDIIDPDRTIFVGDMLEQDIAFGTICGFQKLLVLSGGTTLESLEDTTNKDFIPDFVIESLGHLSKTIDIANEVSS